MDLTIDRCKTMYSKGKKETIAQKPVCVLG